MFGPIQQETAYTALTLLIVIVVLAFSVAGMMWFWRNRARMAQTQHPQARKPSRRMSIQPPHTPNDATGFQANPPADQASVFAQPSDTRQEQVDQVVTQITGSSPLIPPAPSGKRVPIFGYQVLVGGILCYAAPVVQTMFGIHAPAPVFGWQPHLMGFVLIVLLIVYSMLVFSPRGRQPLLAMAGVLMLFQNFTLVLFSYPIF